MATKETRTTSSSGAEKGVKAWAYDLIPTRGVTCLAELYGLGAAKYDEHNFRKGYEWSKTFAAMERHANLFWAGEDYDLELGSHHLINVAWHAAAGTEFFFARRQFDNRDKAPEAAESEYLEFEVEPIPETSFNHKYEDLRPGKRDSTPRYDLIPLRPLALLSNLYGQYHNSKIREGEVTWSSLYSALQFHANSWWSGEDYDQETRILHTVWVMYYAFELHSLYERSLGEDDRLIEGATPIGYDSSPF